MMISAQIRLLEPESGYQLLLDFSSSDALLAEATHLCFSLAHPLNSEAIQGATLIERQGDWHRLRLESAFFTGDRQIRLSGDGTLKKATDFPEGIYVETANGLIDVEVPDLTQRYFVEPTAFDDDTPQFIPQCQITLISEQVAWPVSFNFKGTWHVAWLQRCLAQLKTPVAVVESDQGWPVNLIQDDTLAKAFHLTLSSNEIKLTYANAEGKQAGQAYVFQYLLQLAIHGQLKAVALSGSAKFAYRGVHLDVVRHFFDVDDISRWLDIFALFQFNHFHWHLTDDDGWRLQSQAYPELTEVGAWRGPNETLPPQMGTGQQRYGGFYRAADVSAIVQQAEGLAMQVVPEMDLPGHARALLKGLPQLIEPDDHSQYRSVQHHNDNVINPALVATNPIIETLIDEWCELFPGTLFHIGADEVPKGVWQQSPAAHKWQLEQGKPLSQLQPDWIAHIERYLAAKGKRLAGWEEVCEGKGASEHTWVYSWQGVEAGLRAAEQGHKVVMTPAQSCYLDLAFNSRFTEPGYWWAGTVDLSTVYQYQPGDGFGEFIDGLQGVQYCLWTELVSNAKQAEYMWFPRLLAGAQVVWGGNTKAAYGDFLCAAERWSNVLAHLNIGVRAEKNEEKTPVNSKA